MLSCTVHTPLRGIPLQRGDIWRDSITDGRFGDRKQSILKEELRWGACLSGKICNQETLVWRTQCLEAPPVLHECKTTKTSADIDRAQ